MSKRSRSFSHKPVQYGRLKPTQMRTRNIRIWFVRSPNAIWNYNREPQPFLHKDKAMACVRSLRSIGCDVILEYAYVSVMPMGGVMFERYESPTTRRNTRGLMAVPPPESYDACLFKQAA